MNKKEPVYSSYLFINKIRDQKQCVKYVNNFFFFFILFSLKTKNNCYNAYERLQHASPVLCSCSDYACPCLHKRD